MHLIKRYSNRKLYDTFDRRQVTLDGIAQLVRSGQDIKVVDNDSEEDITTVILTEILLERERRSTGPFSKTILTGLVQAGSATLDQFRRTLTGMGIVQLAEQETERVINTWIELGHMTEQEVLRTVEGVIERRRKSRGDIDEVIEERIASALRRADMPSRDELGRLMAQLHGLNVQIGTLIDELHRQRRAEETPAKS
ncbi:MAG: polyhydroxyalkanoate synthesis regulator DNA-binding domain-containing protein [Chloroflexota bacterium]